MKLYVYIVLLYLFYNALSYGSNLLKNSCVENSFCSL